MATCSISDNFTITEAKEARRFIRALCAAEKAAAPSRPRVTPSVSGRDAVRAFFAGKAASK
jgi:hypothetical protein